MNEDAFRDAATAASQLSATQSASVAAQACPLATLHTIDVRVIGEDAAGLSGQPLRLERADGAVLRAATDWQGRCVFTGLEPGSYRLTIPGWDRDAWFVVDDGPLDDALRQPSGAAAWDTAAAPASPPESDHAVAQGECVAKIAYRYGFAPDTIWGHPDNAALKAARGDQYVIAAGDRLHIPALRPRSKMQATDTRLTVRRKAVPERLRVRFLQLDGNPRFDVPYSVTVATPAGRPGPAVNGRTDAQGFVDVAVMPDATAATITLGEGDDEENYAVAIGALDPLDTIAGWQARLDNLGHSCGAERGKPGPRTAAAVAAFQHEQGLPETGIMDASTAARLHAAELS